MENFIQKDTTLIASKYGDTRLLPLILVLDEKDPFILESASYYTRMLLEKDKPQSSLKEITRHIAKIWDYYSLVHKKSKNIRYRRLFLESLAKDLKSKSVLNWDNLSDNNITKHLHNIKMFCLWVKSHTNCFDKHDKAFIKTIIESYDFLQTLPHSTLFNPEKIVQSTHKQDKVIRSFPVDKIFHLIEKTPNPRDKIMFILMAFGGRRPSEILHLFCQDFIVNDSLKVIIADPETSYFKWNDKTGTREEYLKEVFDLKPRNKIGGNSFVGWRGMRFENNKLNLSEIYFISQVQNYLLSLHLEYIKFRRDFLDHPYYFVSKNGDPLTLTSFYRAYDRALKRVGLTDREAGNSPYGLRHFYGYYCAKKLELDKIVVQRLIGFTNPKFVDKYLVDKRQSFKQLDKIYKEEKWLQSSPILIQE